MKRKIKISLIIVGVIVALGALFWGLKSGNFLGLADMINDTGPGVHIHVKFQNGAPGANYYVDLRGPLGGGSGVPNTGQADASGNITFPANPTYYGNYNIYATRNQNGTPVDACDFSDPTKVYAVNQSSVSFAVVLPCGSNPNPPSPTSGGFSNITGKIISADGAALPAYVWMTQENQPLNVQLQTTIADADGQYFFAAVPEGKNYYVKASYIGYSEGTTAKFELPPNQTVTKNITLNKRPPNKFDVLMTIRSGTAFIAGAKITVWNDTNPSQKYITTSMGNAVGGTFPNGQDINAVIPNLDTPEYNNPVGQYYLYHVTIESEDYFTLAGGNVTFKAPDDLTYWSEKQYLYKWIQTNFPPIPKFTLKGRVNDSRTLWPIYGAKVELTNSKNGKKYSNTADEFGMYQIDNIPIADQVGSLIYTVFVTASNYKNYSENLNTAYFYDKNLLEKDFLLESTRRCPALCPTTTPGR